MKLDPSNVSVFARQVTFLLLVALRQSRRPVAALPVDVWHQRILPAVLPGAEGFAVCLFVFVFFWQMHMRV